MSTKVTLVTRHVDTERTLKRLLASVCPNMLVQIDTGSGTVVAVDTWVMPLGYNGAGYAALAQGPPWRGASNHIARWPDRRGATHQSGRLHCSRRQRPWLALQQTTRLSTNTVLHTKTQINFTSTNTHAINSKQYHYFSFLNKDSIKNGIYLSSWIVINIFNVSTFQKLLIFLMKLQYCIYKLAFIYSSNLWWVKRTKKRNEVLDMSCADMPLHIAFVRRTIRAMRTLEGSFPSMCSDVTC